MVENETVEHIYTLFNKPTDFSNVQVGQLLIYTNNNAKFIGVKVPEPQNVIWLECVEALPGSISGKATVYTLTANT